MSPRATSSVKAVGVAVIAALAIGALVGPFGIASGYGPAEAPTPRPGGGYGGDPPSGLSLQLRAAPQSYASVKRNGLAFRASTSCRCSVTMKLRVVHKGKTLGRLTQERFPQGRQYVVLTKGGKRALKGKSIDVVLKGFATVEDLTSPQTSVTIELSR